MKLELAYPTATLPGNPIPYNLSRTTPIWFPVNGDDISGLDNLTLESSKEEGNQIKRTMSGDLLFYDNVGGTKTLILTAFYDSPSPVDYMWVRIYDCECGEWIFKGQITRDKIEWCSGDCFVKCRASQYDEITDAYNSLNNVLNYDAYEADVTETYINIPSYDDPGIRFWFYESVRVGGLLKNTIQYLPEFVFRSSILDSPTGLNGWTGDTYGIDMDAYGTLPVDGYNTIEMPMGNTNPYHYTYLINSDVSKPRKYRDTSNSLRSEHRYLRTVKQFFEELKTVYNADYMIKMVGSQVHFIFERKDYFFQTSTIWKDCTNYNACFEIDNRNQYAYANCSYQQGTSNANDVSDPLLNAQYRAIVEWNNPISPIQKDAYMAQVMYGSVPVNKDSVGIMEFKQKAYITPAVLVIPGAAAAFLEGPKNIGIPTPPHYTDTVLDMNRPLWFIGNITKVFYPDSTESKYYNCNLFDCFHFIENPRDAPNHVGYKSKYSKKYLRFNVEVEFSCAEYLAFSNDSAVMIDVFGTPSKATIENVDWDFKKRTCKIRGII